MFLEMTGIKFAKRVFLAAGVYGVLVLLPQYFMEGKISADNPPAITHSEYFYGFIGVGIAWQILFLVIARDPVRYRLAMLPSVLEKLTFCGATAVLYFQQKLALQVFVFGLVDLTFAALFIAAFVLTNSRSSAS
jgi:hypothetical protein